MSFSRTFPECHPSTRKKEPNLTKNGWKRLSWDMEVLACFRPCFSSCVCVSFLIQGFILAWSCQNMQPLLQSDVSYAADAWPSVVDFCVFGLFDELSRILPLARFH